MTVQGIVQRASGISLLTRAVLDAHSKQQVQAWPLFWGCPGSFFRGLKIV